MPASANRSLFLQVSGDVSDLKAKMKDGKSALLDLTRAADETGNELQQAFRNISTDPAALKQLVASYDATFATIRRNAQAALASNDNGSALSIINATGAQQQASAAQAQAAQLRIAADAAAAVAERQGEAGVAARVLAQALEVQAVDAAAVAAAMRGQAGVLAEVAAEAKLAGASEDEVSGAHARMGASGMIAEHVIRSLSDSIAAGQSPVRALTMEMGRISEALTLFAQNVDREAKGAVASFAAFMGGPWGLAISAATALLTPLIAELFEMHDAAKLAELGNDGLADAQSALGKMFDLTSGKLDKQNSLLRLNAELTAINLRAKATDDKTKSDATFASLGTSSWSNFFLSKYTSGEIGVAPMQLLNMVFSGKIDAAEAARRGQTVDMTGSKVSRTDFVTALGQMIGAQYENKGADDIETRLARARLPDELKNPAKDKKPRKPKVDHSAERAANQDRAYEAELSQAQDRYAKAQVALADTAEGRYEISIAELDAAKTAKDREIADQLAAGKFGKADSDIAKAKAAQLTLLNYQTTDLEKQAAQRTRDSYYINRFYQLAEGQLDAQIALDQIDEQMAMTRKQRLALELKLLDEQRRKALLPQQAIVDDPNASADKKQDARTAIATINVQSAKQVDAANQQNADPLTKYRQNLVANVGDMNDALKGVEADGLRSIEDGLSGLISGTESAAQAFKKMADAIISDLVRIGIEKAIVSIFGWNTGVVDAPGHATGLIPSFADGIIRGPGTGTSDSIPGYLEGVGAIRVSNGESIITAKATRENAPWLRAMNKGLKLPGFATGMIGDAGMPSIPNSYPALPRPDELRSHQQVTVHTITEVQPNEMFDVRSRSIAQETVGAAAQPIMLGATAHTVKKLRRLPLPGTSAG